MLFFWANTFPINNVIRNIDKAILLVAVMFISYLQSNAAYANIQITFDTTTAKCVILCVCDKCVINT